MIVNKIINKLDSNPEAQNSTIVIHGDHGQRIPHPAENADSFASEEYTQYFSTFFSIRSPSLTPSYDRRSFALDELFKVSVLKKPDFLGLENKKRKNLYIQPIRELLLTVPKPINSLRCLHLQTEARYKHGSWRIAI